MWTAHMNEQRAWKSNIKCCETCANHFILTIWPTNLIQMLRINYNISEKQYPEIDAMEFTPQKQ